MVLYASEFDQSKYLKAADLNGGEKRVKIRVITRESDIGEKQETKAVVWFTNVDKGLIPNKTNLRTLQAAFGDVMDAWIGKVVVLFSIMANYRGDTVPALRVRIPPPKDNTKAAVSPPPAPPKTPKPPADEELDSFDPPLDDELLEVR